jgi:hypothetical protein
VVEFACGIPHLLNGEHSRNVGSEVDTDSVMKPLGVCAGISPFNFPVMVPMWMFPVALAAGNTFVLKPSEKDPALFFGSRNCCMKPDCLAVDFKRTPCLGEQFYRFWCDAECQACG